MIYDLDKLIEGKSFIKENIKNLEAALEVEREKLVDYEKHIEDAQEILKLHGKGQADESSG